MVGVVLLLLPPVLGVPVYLASVAVLVAHDLMKGADIFLERLTDCRSWAWTSSCQSAEWNSILGKCCHQEGDWCHHEVEDFMVVYVG
eukprot:36395-Amphidinium_carterae.1